MTSPSKGSDPLPTPPVHARDVNVDRELGPFPGADRVLGVCVNGPHVWFATGDGIARLDAQAGRVTTRLTVDADAGTAFDGEHLYQLANDTIQKIDPQTGDVLGSIPAPAAGRDSGMAWAEGSLWVGEYRAGKIHRIDPATGELLATIRSDRFVTGVAWHAGELWHGSRHDERSELRRIDLEGNVRERLRLPSGVMVAGLDLADDGSLVCGGGGDAKIRVVRRSGRAAKP